MPLHYTWLAHSTEHLHGLQNTTKLGAQRAWGQEIDGYSPTALQLLQPKSEITFALSASYDAVVHFPLALNFLNVMMILASGARIGMKSLIMSTTSTGLQFMSHTAVFGSNIQKSGFPRRCAAHVEQSRCRNYYSACRAKAKDIRL
jgi:hypothetical protein